MSTWTRAPLPPEDLAALDTVTWRAFPRDTVVAVAEGWNAGMTTADMAATLNCRPASLRMMIGKLKQCGVSVRKAGAASRPSGAISAPVPPVRSALATRLGLEHMARLKRLAPYDPAAARALALLEGAAA